MFEPLRAAAAATLSSEEPMASARLVDFDMSLVLMLGLFLVFVFIIIKVIARPMMDNQDKRHASMEGAREHATGAELEAAQSQLDYENAVRDARQSAVAVRDQLRDEANTVSQGAIASVRASTEAQVAAGEKALADEAAKARSEFAAHAAAIADQVALKLIAAGGAS